MVEVGRVNRALLPTATPQTALRPSSSRWGRNRPRDHQDGAGCTGASGEGYRIDGRRGRLTVERHHGPMVHDPHDSRLTVMLRALEHDDQVVDLSVRRVWDEKRLRAGVPIEDILRPTRGNQPSIQDRLLELAEEHGVAGKEVVVLARLLWQLSDAFSARAAAPYRQQGVALAVAEQRRRDEWLMALLAGNLGRAQLERGIATADRHPARGTTRSARSPHRRGSAGFARAPAGVGRRGPARAGCGVLALL